MALSYENISHLVTTPGLLSRLLDLKLDGIENNVGFQWLGPHFLSSLHYTTELCVWYRYQNKRSSFLDYVSELCLFKDSADRFSDMLKLLDDSANYCILYGDAKHYREFLKLILSFMPELREFSPLQLANWTGIRYPTKFKTRIIGVLVQIIGDILDCGTDYSVLVSSQVKVLLNALKRLYAFLAETVRCKLEENENILTEIEGVSNEAGLFLHSFFFTTQLISVAQMDQEVYFLLKSIEIVQVKIKYHWIAVSKKLNRGVGSLQFAESSSEKSSQDKSIPEVEEIIDIVGFEKMRTKIGNKLLGGPNNRQIISIVGMPGLGKTTLAKKLYNDFNVRSRFDKLSWCVVSQIYTKKRLVIDILSSISNHPRDEILKMENEDLFNHLYQSLKGLQYLIIMDDIWDKEAWNDLTKLFPDDNTGSRILFTSRQRNVASKISNVIIQPLALSEGDCWELLKQKVFKKKRCPQELQEFGKRIAANCKGLPLLVVVIAAVLSNTDKRSLWIEVASSTSSFISKNADGCLSILKLSYENLPIHLKPCFLYLNAFKEDKEVPVRKLLSLWIAEGFIEKKDQKSFEEVAEEYLSELIDRNLLQVSKRRSDNRVKSCTVHDLILDMCWKVAEQENFIFQHQFLVSKHRHRLCMDQSHHFSEAFSVLYNSERIRILDLPSIYTRNDLLGITVMSNLSYLEIYSLKSSLGRLENLDFLSVKYIYEIEMYLLSMPKLRHLHVGSGDIPTRFDENCDSSHINSLQTLSFIYISNSKDEEILNCSPNLRSLKCISSPDRCPNLSFLTQLMSLKMEFERSFIGNYSEVNFPRNVRKLTLSKMGLPWEKISEIGMLPNLEILKLEWGAFKGELWNTKDDEFQKLKFLKLDCLDLKQWNSSKDHFPVLERLVLRECNFEMIPSEFGVIPTLQMIEVRYCGNGVKDSALQIREEQNDFGNEEFEVIMY